MDISRLYFIESLSGSLSIDNNDSLTNLNGLDNLHTVGKSVIIIDNEVLDSLDGIAQLRTIQTGIISNNPLISYEEEQQFRSQINEPEPNLEYVE